MKSIRPNSLDNNIVKNEKKSVKKNNPTNIYKSVSTLDKKPNGPYEWLDEYRDLISFKTKPVSREFIERLSQELVIWARDDEEALKVSQFYLVKGIPAKTYHRFLERYEVLSDAHQVAIMLIGNRREMGALKRKFDTGMVTAMMPYYDADWKSMLEWKNKMRIEENASADRRPVILGQLQGINEVKG